jgi:holo-[acyl-carrier protein] synthase
VIVGLGVDIVEIARAARLLESYGGRALARTCTDAEAAYVRARPRPAQHFAARLAAKEAAFKALAGSERARLVGWREIEVIAADGGPPGLRLHGTARERGDELGVRGAWLSISHGDSSAVAVVVLES